MNRPDLGAFLGEAALARLNIPRVVSISNLMPPYTGLVATRCGCPTNFASVNKQFMSRSKHIATENISALQVVCANFYALLNGGESSPGGTATFTASIEYPAGTIAGIFTFSGSTSGTAPDGGTITSDLLSLAATIPRGAVFYLRRWANMPAGIVYNANYALNNVAGSVPNSGEWVAFGVTTADLTQSTTNSNNMQAGICFKPAAIIGPTIRPTFYLAGDSRLGNGTNYDQFPNAWGAIGEVERSLMKMFASFNAGNAGETMAQAAGTSSAKRLTLAQYCSHVICEYGINDISAGTTPAALLTSLYTLAAKFGGKPVYACTLGPRTTSTDSWATTANQTTNANNANRVTYNNYLRNGVASPVVGCIELADQVESARDSGVWKVTGIAFGYTGDGLHGNNFGNGLIETSTALIALGMLWS